MTCQQVERTYRRDGEWMAVVRSASASGIAALKGAFEQPGRFYPRNTACLDVLIIWPPVLFVDRHGHYILARYPIDHPCGHPLAAALRAARQHAWTAVSTTKVKQVLTARQVAATRAAQSAGCSYQLKDMVAIDSQLSNDSSPGGPVLTRHPQAPLHACIFRLSASDPDVGTYVRAVHFDARQSVQVRRALTGPGNRSDACPTEQTFANISTLGENGVWLEVGGCWRLERDQGPGLLGTASNPTAIFRLLR